MNDTTESGISRKALVGQVALVTGAGKNIGRQIALYLAEVGAQIAVNGLSDREAVDSVVEEINARHGQGTARGYMADVTDGAAVKAMVDAVALDFGRLDIVITNPAMRRQTPFPEMSYDEWSQVLQVALDGAFHTISAAVPRIIEGGRGGRIVTMSGVSTRLGTKNRAHVCAAKGGLEGFTRGLASDLADYGITVNSVSPGAVDTVRGAAAGALPGRLVDDSIPLKRKGRPEEVAAMVRHLCLPEAAYITGQVMQVNGGVYYS
ncbi:MAG TPA: SDR family NAD(P)-dependent oxidoreductase [Alphaproteobacteria bacterium]|nr:SDR family NAD(P)-dependent oxidoreductase [Alphaproteobacteria bacterium]